MDTEIEASGFDANPLALAGVVDSLVDQYNAAVELVIERHKLLDRLNFYTRQVMTVTNVTDIDLNSQLDDLKGKFWDYVFEKTQIGKELTSNYQEKVNAHLGATRHIAFTVENITSVVEGFYINRGSIMQQCIAKTFDTATAYHRDNIIHNEGWKTNKSYRIAPKIIMPDGVTYDQRWSSWSTSYRHHSFFEDLDRVMAYLDGKRLEDVNMQTFTTINKRCKYLSQHEGERYDKLFTSTYFRIRFFKKGTVHLVFLREDLLNEFNRQAAIGKQWVGGGY